MLSIYKKELQSYFYSPLAYVISAIFLLIFSWDFVNYITNLNAIVFSFSFATIFYNKFYFFIFLIPALTMKTFAEERKNGTEVMLMSAPVSVLQIVTGKFLAVATVYLTMTLLTVIFPIITAFNGGVLWSSLICGYIGFFFWGLVCIAIGILVSSFTENQIIALIISEASMVFLLLVDNLKENAFFSSISWVSAFLNWLSPQERFYGFSKGMFSLGDLIFYITCICAFLAWTMIIIEKRRWKRG